MSKKDKELQKKEEINEVLLQRIKCLKNALADLQSKKSEDASYEEKNTKSNKSSTSNEEGGHKAQAVVGGYFGSIFN